jgi:hypothetical protein
MNAVIIKIAIIGVLTRIALIIKILMKLVIVIIIIMIILHLEIMVLVIILIIQLKFVPPVTKRAMTSVANFPI